MHSLLKIHLFNLLQEKPEEKTQLCSICEPVDGSSGHQFSFLATCGVMILTCWHLFWQAAARFLPTLAQS